MSDHQDPLFHLPLPEERELGEGIEDVLRQIGGLTAEEIVERLHDDGWNLGDAAADDVAAELESEERPFYGLSDDRWVHLPTLLDGGVFTHRLTPTEVEHDVLPVVPDLSLLQWLIEFADLGQLAGGGELGFVFPEGVPSLVGRKIPSSAVGELGSLVLPPGTIAGLGLAAGDLVGLCYTSDGIEVMGVDAMTEPVTQCGDYVLELLRDAGPQEVNDVLVSLLTDVPDAFAEPWPPITEVLDSWGVVEQDGLLAEPNFDFDEWIAAEQATWQAEHYGLSPQEGAVVRTLHAMLRAQAAKSAEEAGPGKTDDSGLSLPDLLQQRLGLSSELLEALTGCLADPLISYALLDQWQQEPSWAEPLGGFCTALESLTPRRARVGLYWLWAKAAEGVGDSRTAETFLRKAERLDPGWPAVLVDLARYAGDRGDAVTGLSLLRRLDGDANPFLREILERFQSAPASTMPRNAPCWCGSGRKFKQCHLRLGQVRSLADRAAWLYLKAEVYAAETPWRASVDSLVEIRSAHATAEQEADEMAWDGLVMDTVLFEGGVFAEYVDRQGWLLPSDELLLAQQWLLVERSVYEVVEVDSGAGMTLRDLRTGADAVVADPTASEFLEPGGLVCTHLLPLPDRGFLEPPCMDPVPEQQRDELLVLLDAGATPAELVAFLSRRFALSEMRTPEGHELVVGHLQLTSPDPIALTAALDAAYERSSDDSVGPDVIVWHKMAGDDGAHLHATMALRESELVVEAASRERLATARSELLAVQPGLLVTDEDYRVVDAELVRQARATLAISERAKA